MEYREGNLGALDFYAALKMEKKPVELVFYRGAPHIFTQPQQRFHAMHRNLDWFNFWLRGVEDPAPEKREQYVRWRDMRDSRKRIRR